MKVERYLYIVVMLLAFLFSCKKEATKILPQLKACYVGKDVRINDIHLLNDSVWLACGGIRNSEGYIFRTEDAGKTWTTFHTDSHRSMYCLAFKDSLHGFAGSDFLDLWETFDGGKTWQYYWLGLQVPLNEEDRPAIRDFYFVNDSLWYFCGGENLYKGVIYQTQNSGTDWSFEFIENEFRGMCFDDEMNGVVAGHGTVRLFRQSNQTTMLSDFKNDFMTSIGLLGNSTFLGASYSGKIYSSEDKGETWEVIEKQGARLFSNLQWNDIFTDGSKAVAVGNYGYVAISNDVGGSWNYYRIEENTHLLKCVISNSGLFVSTNDGRILILGFES